ncbi:MAG: HAD hydrolase-like protein [Clostridia bacterium]|nr:HAD hydrolase-like protein [Clostridia bacterium]
MLDTSEGVLESVRDTITKLNLKELTNAEIKTFIGPPVEWSFKDKCGMDGEDLVETCKVFRDIYANRNLLRATPYEGIFELMAKLKEKGIKLAVATYKKEAYTGRLLDEYGFDKYLDIFHGSDPEGKLLKSDIIELCLKEMGVTSYADVLMVGDSKHDAGGAASLGIDFAGVSYGFGFGEGDFAADDINDYPHVAYVDKPLELLNLF